MVTILILPKGFINQLINSLPSSKSTGFSSALSLARFFSFFLFLISSTWFSFPLPLDCLDAELLLLSLDGDFSTISCFFSFSCFVSGSEASFLLSFWALVATDLLTTSLVPGLLSCSLVGDVSCLLCFWCLPAALLETSFEGDFSTSCLLSFPCFGTTLLTLDFELAASFVFCFVSALSSFTVVTWPFDWIFYKRTKQSMISSVVTHEYDTLITEYTVQHSTAYYSCWLKMYKQGKQEIFENLVAKQIFWMLEKEETSNLQEITALGKFGMSG